MDPLKARKKNKRLLLVVLSAVVIFFSIALGYKEAKADTLDKIGGFFSFFPPTAPAVNVGKALVKGASKKVADVATNIMDEAFEGLSKNVVDPSNRIAERFTFGDLINGIGPDSGLFNTMLGGNGSQILSSITKAVSIIAAAIAIILFVLYCMTYIMSPDKVKTSPLKAIVRLLLVAAFITSAWQTMSFIENDIMGKLYKSMTFELSGTPEKSVGLSDLYFQEDVVVDDKEQTTSGAFFGGSVPEWQRSPFRYIPTIISLIMIIPIIKEFLKLVIECIERYVVLHILLTISPIAASTFTTESTENIGKSYIQMVLAQFFLTSMSRIYIISTMLVIYTAYIPCVSGKLPLVYSVLSILVCLAVMKAFQRIDTYIRAMGVGVAQTTGALADSIQSSLRNLGRSVGSAISGANRTRKAAGAGMQAIGANTGNRALFNAGTVMGVSLANGGIPTKSALSRQWGQSQGALGRSVSMDAQNSKNILAGYLQNMRGNQDAAGALDQKSKVAGAKLLTGLDVQSASIDNKGGLNLTWKDENGNEHSGKFSMSESAASEAIYGDNGKLAGFLETYPDGYAESLAQQGYNTAIEGSTATEMLENAGNMAIAAKTDMFEPIHAGVSADVNGFEGTPIASISDDVTASYLTQRGQVLQNAATDENVALVENGRNGASRMLFNAGFTQFDTETGQHAITSEGAQTMAQLHEAKFPGETVRRDDNGNPKIIYDAEKHQYRYQVQQNGSENYIDVIAQDLVRTEKVDTGGKRIVGDAKAVWVSKESDHRSGFVVYHTGNKVRTDKK